VERNHAKRFGIRSFVLIDAAWLSTMAKMLYRPVLGDILLSNLKIAPAAAFYAMFPSTPYLIQPELPDGARSPGQASSPPTNR
jgi:uncharacterized membrane protein